MIERLEGGISSHGEKLVTVLCGGVGYLVHTPQASALISGRPVYVSYQWSAEKGPSLYGFPSASERELFELIITCPKIGPSIALSLLAALSASGTVAAITTQDYKTLSSAPGVGLKKAEQIVVSLRDKIAHFVGLGHGGEQWHALTLALQGLGYLPREIAQVTQTLRVQGHEGAAVDVLLRKAMLVLAQQQRDESGV